MHSLVRDYIQFSRVTEYAQSSQVLCTVYSLAMQSLVGILTISGGTQALASARDFL